MVKPKRFGPDGPTMGPLFGTSAIDKTYDVCDILERIAPNVSELQLFRDSVGGMHMHCKSLSVSSSLPLVVSDWLVLRHSIWEECFALHRFVLRSPGPLDLASIGGGSPLLHWGFHCSAHFSLGLTLD